jgi:hypothetical protein
LSPVLQSALDGFLGREPDKTNRKNYGTLLKTSCFSKKSPIFEHPFKENLYIFIFIVIGCMYASIGWWVNAGLVFGILYKRNQYHKRIWSITKILVEGKVDL